MLEMFGMLKAQWYHNFRDMFGADDVEEALEIATWLVLFMEKYVWFLVRGLPSYQQLAN